ncbi:MAG: OmpA family protein [Saprospiraceae bacterium]|nr:OmpA family protein [Saprospiraceae bacterium]
MRKMYLFLLLVFVVTSGVRAQELLRESVFFDTDQHQLTTAARQTLDELLIQTLDLTDFHLQILAFTDDRGSTDYNYHLALKRGQSVQTYLQSLGLEVERSSIESLGEVLLETPNEQERSRNRRVDLILTAKLIGSLSEVWEALDQDRLQKFTIDAQQGNVVEGRAGTRVWIPAGAFIFADGQRPEGPITLKMREAYDFGAMLVEGLSTHSDGQLLETGGMVYLEAEADGQALQLDTDQAMAVALPTKQMKDGMQLFMGEQAADGSVTNWSATQQAPAPSLDEYLLDLPPFPKVKHDWIKPPKEIIDYSGEPVTPRKPIKPHAPTKPRREAVVYYPRGMEGIFMSKAKREKKEEAMFEKKMAAYNRKLANFKERQAGYRVAMEKYQHDFKVFQQAQKDYQAKIQAQKDNFKSTPAYLAYAEQVSKSKDARRALYEKEVEEWYAAKDQRITEYEAKYGDVLLGSSTMAMEYLYRVNRLGWINCDRFYQVPNEEKVDLAIADDDVEQEQLFVIFKDIKSMMRASKWKENANYQVSNLPRNMDIRVVGIKVVDGKAQLAIKDTKVSDEKPVKLSYQPASINKIRSALSNLDS